MDVRRMMRRSLAEGCEQRGFRRDHHARIIAFPAPLFMYQKPPRVAEVFGFSRIVYIAGAAGALGAALGALPPDEDLPLSASFKPLPALNLGTVTEGIWIFSVGFWGFTPVRPLRVLAMNAPKPAMFTSPPFCRVSVTVVTKVSTMSSACFFVTPHL